MIQQTNSDRPPGILVIDDDRAARELIESLMHKNGYTTFSAEDGESGVAVAIGQAHSLEVIILDIMLPGTIDGYEVIQRLKENPLTVSLPIVVLSARNSSADIARSYSKGAVQHITKPYNIQHLDAVVFSMIRLRQLEEASIQNAEKYKAIVENSPVHILVLDRNMRIVEMNAAFRKNFSHVRLQDNLFDSCFDVQPSNPENHPVMLALTIGHKQEGVTDCLIQGRRRFLQIHATPIKDLRGEISNIITVIIDVTEQHNLEQDLRKQIERHNRAIHHQDLLSDHLMSVQRELKEKNIQLEEARQQLELLSITDPLTGLYNRRHFDLALVNESVRCKRYRHPLSLCIMDIDHFKQVNDEYGHPTGDIVLKELARILQNHLRETDTIARYGGEEFAAILPETDQATAMMIAERLRATIEHHSFETDAGSIRMSVSIGLCSVCRSKIDIDELLQATDEALYVAKNKGRNQIYASETMIFDDRVDQQALIDPE